MCNGASEVYYKEGLSEVVYTFGEYQSFRKVQVIESFGGV